MTLIERLIYARRGPLRVFVKQILALHGIECPPEVEIGVGLRIYHRAFGTVIHPSTVIGDNVRIYHGVTVGRADVWSAGRSITMEAIHIGDGAILCAGATVICKTGILTIGAGSIIGANSVLTKSTGANEIWAGSPARLVGMRTT